MPRAANAFRPYYARLWFSGEKFSQDSVLHDRRFASRWRFNIEISLRGMRAFPIEIVQKGTRESRAPYGPDGFGDVAESRSRNSFAGAVPRGA